MRTALCLTLGLLACGTEAIEPRDVRVPIPAPDPEFEDLVTPEVVFEPGEDKMFCINLDYAYDEVTGIQTLIAQQGQGGHHIVLLSTSAPKPHGTMWDCTSDESMRDIRPLVLPLELGDGQAVHLGRSGQLVLQFHYVNTFEEPILTRDVARLKLKKEGEVTQWVSSFATNDTLFNVPPTGTDRVDFDCEVQDDTELLLVGGHLHEWGTRFETLVGPDVDNLESVYLVDPWRSEFRDSPPVTLFRNEPYPLKKGDIIRTSCSWENDTDEPLEFPHEMCSTFGYLGNSTESWVCDTAGILDGSRGFMARYPDQ